MIDLIISITIFIAVLVGFALLAIWSQGNPAVKNDVVEQGRETFTASSVAKAFDCDCTIIGTDALNNDFDEQTETLTVFSIAQAFDRDCAIIWSTQVSALQVVDDAGIKGVPVKRLYPFFSRSVRRYPELYDGSSFGSWLVFLEREHLITRRGLEVLITEDGHNFLQYRLAPECIRTA